MQAPSPLKKKKKKKRTEKTDGDSAVRYAGTEKMPFRPADRLQTRRRSHATNEICMGRKAPTALGFARNVGCIRMPYSCPSNSALYKSMQLCALPVNRQREPAGGTLASSSGPDRCQARFLSVFRSLFCLHSPRSVRSKKCDNNLGRPRCG